MKIKKTERHRKRVQDELQLSAETRKVPNWQGTPQQEYQGTAVKSVCSSQALKDVPLSSYMDMGVSLSLSVK